MTKIKIKLLCLLCENESISYIYLKKKLSKDNLINFIEFSKNPNIKINSFCYECESITTHLILEIL